MRILIIGGTRFVGPHVVQSLADMGHEVIVFHRGETESDLTEGVKHIHGDLSHLLNFKDEFQRFRPQVMLHMIPNTAQDAWAAMRTLEGAAGRVVAISSQDVYRAYNRFRGLELGPADPTPIAEDAPLREKLFPYRHQSVPHTDNHEHRNWFYEYDKILVERIVMSEPDLPGTILRLPAVYGPNDPQHRLFEHLKRMDDHRPLILIDEGAASWLWTRGYVENVAHAIVLAVTDERAASRIYNVGEANALTETEWVNQIAQAAEWEGQVVCAPGSRLPDHLRQEYVWGHHLAVDTSRIRNDLDYAELVPRDEALRRTVAWERANPPEEIDQSRFDYEAEDAILSKLHGS